MVMEKEVPTLAKIVVAKVAEKRKAVWMDCRCLPWVGKQEMP